MISGVWVWWITLGTVSVANVGLWIYSAIVFARRKISMKPDIYRWRRIILWLSGIYVLGCAFRSLLPRIDLERLCLVNSWLSSMLVGRSVATVAELSFIVQCAILLCEAGKAADDRFSILVSLSLIPLIFAAEGFSWYAVISTHYLGSVVEESLWTVSGVLLLASFISLWPQVNGIQRHFLTAMILFAIGFVVFMVTVDVPMYWSRWQADIAAGSQYLSLRQGIMDSAKSCLVSFDWQLWREEIPWMTLYFTVAVWVSIYLTHAPHFVIAGNHDSK